MIRTQSSSHPGNIDNFVDGKFVSTHRLFDNVSPVDGSRIGQVSEADQGLVDLAVQSARAALDGPWGDLGVPDRANCLRRIADQIDKRFDEFVDVEIADTGKPRTQARSLDIPRGAANFRIFADLLQSRAGEVFETVTRDGTRAINYSVQKPLGVVAVISPWNLPLLLTTWKLAPALACSLWTENLQRAHRVAPRIGAGLVWVNTWFLRDLRTPFGGIKRSGIGREGGRHSLDFYSDVSNICIRL